MVGTGFCRTQAVRLLGKSGLREQLSAKTKGKSRYMYQSNFPVIHTFGNVEILLQVEQN